MKFLGGFVLAVIVYILLGLLLPLIEVPADKVSEPKTIPIYIYTNGVHTDLVLPIKTEYADWSQKIKFENTKSKQTNFKYVGIGWGDKGFYLDTPTWADLKFSTAFKAAFGLSESAMHLYILQNHDSSRRLQKDYDYSKAVSRFNKVC